MRTCFLHIGTHRTGTTSIQVALSSRRRALCDKGFLYPATGAPPESPYGHHNLAWEVTKDRRFRPEHGTMDALIAELDRSPSHHVLLSSEDFECAAYHPGFDAFVARLQAAGLQVRVLLYLRDQSEYIPSLYSELVKHGLDQKFESYFRQILSRGRYTWREWIFPFDYDDLLTRLEAIDGVQIIVRPYGTPLPTYLSLLGLSAEDLGCVASDRVNARPEARSFSLAPASAQVVAARFDESNARVAARYGVRPSGAHTTV